MDNAAIERAKAQFGKLLEDQMRRIEKVLAAPDWIDYSKVETLRIGILAGDGIGPFIAGEAREFWNCCCRTKSEAGKSSSTISKDSRLKTVPLMARRYPTTSWKRSGNTMLR